MRFTRSLTLLLVLGMAVAGCAVQPTPRLAAASPQPPGATAMGSIDSYAYGSPAYGSPRPLYAAAQTPAPVGRGLFAGPIGSPAPPVAAARSPVVAPPPVARVAAPPATAPISAVTYSPAPQNKVYTLDSGDRLRVVVFGQDGLSNSYLVDASGHIAMPLIGSVSARGLTTDELSSRIAERLRQGFVREPHVAVEVEAYRPFFILGEVTQPGQYPYVADMTVETAVAIAGGFGPRAYRPTVTLTRIVNGRQERMTVPTTYALRPGDTINVQERWF